MLDARLFHRAPFDPALARLLVQRSPAKSSVALDYITGFSKINNPDRFEPRHPPGRRQPASREDLTGPCHQIDQLRIEYLYPPSIDDAARVNLARYLAELETLVTGARAHAVRA